MTAIRVVSFDFWATLGRGNSAYKQGRVNLLATALGVEVTALAQALTAADDELDELTVRNGRQYGLRERVHRTAQLIGADPLPEAQLRVLTDRLDAAFLRDPPSLTESDLPATLAALRRTGRRLAVTSNTGFVSGRLMRIMLRQLGLLHLIDHLVFSDEIGHAKPSSLIYGHLALVAGCDRREILHVGDHRWTDHEGALAAGLHALLYRPGGSCDLDRQPGDGVLTRLSDLIDHPLLSPAAASPMTS